MIEDTIAQSLNVFGQPLELCCDNPKTGFYRDGYCKTDTLDFGKHTVCAIVSNEFLAFSKSKGNDLTRAYPGYNFPGLVAGDHWCLCVSRWLEAYHSNVAPQVILEACHEKTLDYVSLSVLKKFAFDPD